MNGCLRLVKQTAIMIAFFLSRSQQEERRTEIDGEEVVDGLVLQVKAECSISDTNELQDLHVKSYRWGKAPNKVIWFTASQ